MNRENEISIRNLLRIQMSDSCREKPAWKHDTFDFYIYEASNRNWHISESLGGIYTDIYADNQTCPYLQNDERSIYNKTFFI